MESGPVQCGARLPDALLASAGMPRAGVGPTVAGVPGVLGEGPKECGSGQGARSGVDMPGMRVLLALAMQHLAVTVGDAMLRDVVAGAVAAHRRAEESGRLLQELRSATVEALGSVHHLAFTRVRHKLTAPHLAWC